MEMNIEKMSSMPLNENRFSKAEKNLYSKKKIIFPTKSKCTMKRIFKKFPFFGSIRI